MNISSEGSIFFAASGNDEFAANSRTWIFNELGDGGGGNLDALHSGETDCCAADIRIGVSKTRINIGELFAFVQSKQ